MEADLGYILHEFKDIMSCSMNELSLEECLKAEGIEPWQLIDANILKKLLTEKEIKDNKIKLSKLPLEWFDNDDYDSKTTEDWLKTKKDNILLAKAFIPDVNTRNIRILLFSTNLIEWRIVNVEHYEPYDMIWTVRDLETQKLHRLARTYLKFIDEDTTNFADRISNALWRQGNAEKRIKFEMLADCINVDNILDPKLEIIDHIKKLAKPKTSTDRDWFIEIKEELKLNFKRTQGLIELKYAIKAQPSHFPNIHLPSDIDEQLVKRKMEPLSQLYNFHELRRILKFKNLYCIPDVDVASRYVTDECFNVQNMTLFTTISHKTASLANFKLIEESAATKTIDFLQGVWPIQLAKYIIMVLRRAGKGWYDIEISTWEIYNLAKIKRFLQLTKFRMETALRILVVNSIQLYSDLLCKPCLSFINLPENYVWSDDLITSPFDPNFSHVFYMTLQMNETGTYYSIHPKEFKPIILEIYEFYLRKTHYIPLIDPKIMQELTFSIDLFITSIGLLDPIVANTRDNLEKSYTQCVIPLLAYAKKYDVYIDLFVLNVSSYLEEYEDQNKSATEIRDEIIFHRTMKNILECVLPLSIQIGPFLINVSPIKQSLVAKRTELADLMLDYLVRKLNNETNAILSEYNAILKTLSEKPPTIEKLYKTTEWMETIAENVTRLENTMKVKLYDFAILDDFYHPLPNANFNVKVQALYSPIKISNQIKSTNEMFEEEIERFRKQQIEDLATFNERLEELTVSVVYYNTQFEVDKVMENSVDIKKLWKVIKEFGAFGKLLNKRQTLFELPLIDLDAIDQLTSSTESFKDLWVTAADFIKYKEVLIENTLTNVVVKNIHSEIKYFKKTLKKCIEAFREQERIQEVAEHFYATVNDFDLTVECLVLVKNPNWNIYHWQELAQRTGMEIRLPLTRNFSYFQSKGILNFIDVVKQISEDANQVNEETVAV